jgi:hypothetical protein
MRSSKAICNFQELPKSHLLGRQKAKQSGKKRIRIDIMNGNRSSGRLSQCDFSENRSTACNQAFQDSETLADNDEACVSFSSGYETRQQIMM